VSDSEPQDQEAKNFPPSPRKRAALQMEQTGMAVPNRWEATGWATPFGGLGEISAHLS